MTQPSASRTCWSISSDPILILSALMALAYGLASPGLRGQDNPPFFWLAVLKSAPVFLLAFRATMGRSELLCLGLLFGSVGDGFLVWPDRFAHGAIAFLIGHICYIRIFLREGVGAAALRSLWRIAAMAAVVLAAVVMTSLLGAPRESPLFVPLSVYTGVLTLMTLSSFTLPASRWLAMKGAVLFFISDGFVGQHMFHPIADPTLAYWSGFAGWMIYWAGQAAICFGALGLRRARAE